MTDDETLQRFAALPLEHRRGCIDTWRAVMKAQIRTEPLPARSDGLDAMSWIPLRSSEW